MSRDTWCPRRAVRERWRPSQDSWPSWDSTVLGQRKCPGTKRGVLGQPTPSQDGDCPGHRVSRDTFASRTPFASQDIPPVIPTDVTRSVTVFRSVPCAVVHPSLCLSFCPVPLLCRESPLALCSPLHPSLSLSLTEQPKSFSTRNTSTRPSWCFSFT